MTSGGVGFRPRAAEAFLLSGERCVVAIRRHWICAAEPWVTTFASLLFVAWLTFDVASPQMGRPLDLLWWLWFALLGRAVWLTYDHSRTWFIVTDRRLLLVYGVFVRKVAMMPLKKVTDMSYHRTLAGKILGYGTFVMESAGQDQALREIDHVPDPDPAYRAIINQIFNKGAPADDDDDDAGGGSGGGGGGGRAAGGGARGDGRDGRSADDAPYDWPDDPTSHYAMPAEESRRWSDRLRGAGSMAARHFGGSLREHYPGPHPDPTVGARHRVAEPRDEARAGARADSDGGEWLYRSGGSTERDDTGEPPRDATGYWG